jgi:hypothetical protein
MNNSESLPALVIANREATRRALDSNPLLQTCKISHSTKQLFFLSGPFSQWYSCEIIAPEKFFGIALAFTSAEQFMMAAKADVFQDAEAFKKIMKTRNPRVCKDVGRSIRNYVEAEWAQIRFEAVAAINHLKFSQNALLKAALQLTNGYELVEASRNDKIWGIGLDIEDKGLLNRELWTGQNLLGKALMQVRDILIKSDVARIREELSRAQIYETPNTIAEVVPE